jgi:hypothetical protein
MCSAISVGTNKPDFNGSPFLTTEAFLSLISVCLEVRQLKHSGQLKQLTHARQEKLAGLHRRQLN